VSWQKILADGFSSTSALLQHLELPAQLGHFPAEQAFKTRVPRGFVDRMERGNPKDPLLLQVLAQHAELDAENNFTTDPLQEKNVTLLPGLIHKYTSRVLLTLTGTCAIHCRYCFRRHFPYEENNPGRKGWEQIATYIAQHPEIHEVILSGGDPMLATDVSFHTLLNLLESIPHLKTLRIHSRVPIVLPERITENWLTRLAASRFKKVMVLHANHPNELNKDVAEACLAMKEVGFHLLNQSVLLKAINDNVETLTQLNQSLFDMGVLPYYLHLLDKVKGAKHFDMPLDTALNLYRELQKTLPGYLVPKLAREEPGMGHKTLLV
jgi:L-lysine 2,3-aminomutase